MAADNDQQQLMPNADHPSYVKFGTLPKDASELLCGNCYSPMTDEGNDIACVPCGIYWAKALWDAL